MIQYSIGDASIIEMTSLREQEHVFVSHLSNTEAIKSSLKYNSERV